MMNLSGYAIRIAGLLEVGTQAFPATLRFQGWT